MNKHNYLSFFLLLTDYNNLNALNLFQCFQINKMFTAVKV